jgi:predicted GNAT family acetyltransferase
MLARLGSEGRLAGKVAAVVDTGGQETVRSFGSLLDRVGLRHAQPDAAAPSSDLARQATLTGRRVATEARAAVDGPAGPGSHERHVRRAGGWNRWRTPWPGYRARFTSIAQHGRFVIDADGHRALLEFRLRGQVLSVLHTETPSELSGRGFANALARAALDWARAEGFTVKPLLPPSRPGSFSGTRVREPRGSRISHTSAGLTIEPH